MPRETFILTQDIATGQLIDTHPAPGSRMQKIVDKTILDIFTVLNVTVPAATTTKRLDSELNSVSPAVGAGVGVMTTRKHRVFKSGTDHAFVDGTTTEINADIAHTVALGFSISMFFNSAVGTTIGDPGDVQIGDYVMIATPVPFYAQILNKVPNGPNYDLTFSANFVGGITGPYAATRTARWLATFKDSTNAPFPMPGDNVDFGILQRSYLADADEEVLVGPYPEFGPDVAGGGGGGGITGGGTVARLAKFTGATAIGDSVVQEVAGNIGIGMAPGAFKLNVNGPARIDGKLTVTGALDPTSLLLSDPASGTELFIESNDGSTAPLSGAATGRQRYNNTTGRWQQSAQGGAYRTIQTVENDIFAATRVVDPSGNGTDTTIAAAIAALPADGGKIFIKGGTYAISATLSLPDKPIMFCGVGAEATIVDIGANTIAAFTISFDRPYTFAHFSIRGDGSAGQIAWRFALPADARETTEILHMNVGRRIPSIAFPVEVTFDSFGGFAPSISVQDCRFIMPSVAASRLLRGPGSLDIGYSASQAASLVHGGIDDATGLVNFHSKNSVFTGSSWGTFDRFDVVQCTFLGDSPFTVKTACTLFGADFIQVTTGPARWLDLLSTAFQCRIFGTVFGTYTSEAIRVAGVDCAVVSNENCRVLEIGSADRNRYSNNAGFGGSTIIGLDSVVNGVRQKSLTGIATTDVFVSQLTHENTKGLTGGGSIKNTGGSNSLTVQLTATDAYGTTDTQDTVVPALGSATWSIANAVGTALPPFVSYAVAVKSTTPGLPTTFTLHHATGGAY
jgi:hypothetical protein